MRLVKVALRLLAAFVAAVTALSLASVAAAAVARTQLPDASTPEDDDLDLVSIFEGRQFRSSATSFRGGRIVCWNSGLDVDLRGAQLDPAGAHLEVWSAFGGLRLRVPEGWRVRFRGYVVFGGATSSAESPDPADPGPVLEVDHRTIFGAVGLTPEPDDELLAV